MTQWTVDALRKTEWFEPLVRQVQEELDRLSTDQIDRRPALHREFQEVQDQIRGWSQTLAKPDLSPSVRTVIETQLEEAIQKQAALERLLGEHDALRQQSRTIIDPQQLVDRLNRLAEVLATSDATRGNLELSLHIDTIRCSQDGTVVVRTCKLGALAGAVEMLANPDLSAPTVSAAEAEFRTAHTRRRTRLRIANRDENGVDQRAAVQTAADVQRFAGLGPEWFWEDRFQIPRKKCWSEEHAAEVAELRASGLTVDKLAAHFGKTPPTIKKALKLAVKADPSLQTLPRRMPCSSWAKTHAAEVTKLKGEGMTIKAIAQSFGKSVTTIHAALQDAHVTPAETALPPSDKTDLGAMPEGG